MDLWQLKIFTKVVETGSFSKASEAIHLTQPTVSSHIKDLETHFNCHLLDRLGKKSVPTGAGRILYSYARRLLDLNNEAEAAINDFMGNIKGSLLIGGSTIPAGYIIPGFVGSFRERFPGIDLSVISGDSMQIIGHVLTGKVEIGIVGARKDHPDLIQEKLLKDELRLIVPADHEWAGLDAVDADMLHDAPFIAREEGSGTWRALSGALLKAGYDADYLKTVVTFGSTTSVLQGILNKVGVSILSPLAAQEYIRYGRMTALPINGLDLTRYFYLSFHSRRAQSPICREFVSLVREIGSS